MKTQFFLTMCNAKTIYRKNIPTIIGLFIAFVWICIELRPAMMFFFIPLLCFIVFFDIRYSYYAGVYINDKNMLYKGIFFKRNIDIDSVTCIRQEPERYSNMQTYDAILTDENGNIKFQMYFNHGYYAKDEENGYIFIEEIKRMFKERCICRCVFDQEAIDYLLTLNPNIKVIYYNKG